MSVGKIGVIYLNGAEKRTLTWEIKRRDGCDETFFRCNKSDFCNFYCEVSMRRVNKYIRLLIALTYH